MQDKANDVLSGPLSVVITQIDAVTDEWMKADVGMADAEIAALSNARDRIIWRIAGVGLLGAVTFTGFGIYLARRLTMELGRIIAEMRALSAGDLDSQMAADCDPD